MEENSKKTVDTFGEAVGVLVQVANLAQSKGVLSLPEAALVAQALDRVEEFRQQVVASHEQKAAVSTPAGPTSAPTNG